MILRSIIIIYVVLLHLAAGAIAVKADLWDRVLVRLGHSEPADPPIIATLREVHRQMDASVPEGATIFLGDSLTVALATAAVAPRSVNYGIGWQRSDQLIQSMPIYRSIGRAERVVVMIGANDILQNRTAGIEGRYETIISAIPRGVAVTMVSPPPVAKTSFNSAPVDLKGNETARAGSAAACARHSNCTFVDFAAAMTRNGSPLAGTLLPDQIHLTPAGYAILISLLV